MIKERRLMIRLIALITFLAVVPANAGLQSWSVLYLNDNGQAVAYGKHTTAEVWSESQNGWQISIGCKGDDLSLHVKAPDGEKADFAGPEFEPSVRVGKPGTDLFLGPTGEMVFDGARYNGPLPRVVLDAMLEDYGDKQLTFTDFNSRTTVLLKIQRIARPVGELPCAR